MAQESKLFINNQEIKTWEETSGMDLGEDCMMYMLPNHILLEEKSFLKWLGDFDQDEAEQLSKLLRIDGDQFANKRVRIYIQSLGPKPKEGR